MQIKIVQAEIETAIRAHINNIVSVREGMRIDIDLSATRGPEGFTATIDIVPDTADQKPQTEVEQAPASVQTTQRPRVTRAPAEKPPFAQQTTDEPAAEPSEEDLAPAGTVEAKPAETSSGEAPAQRTSLFAGVTTPSNS